METFISTISSAAILIAVTMSFFWVCSVMERGVWHRNNLLGDINALAAWVEVKFTNPADAAVMQIHRRTLLLVYVALGAAIWLATALVTGLFFLLIF